MQTYYSEHNIAIAQNTHSERKIVIYRDWSNNLLDEYHTFFILYHFLRIETDSRCLEEEFE